MGLAVGLLMVVGLLTLILVNGTQVFWPTEVAKISLKPGAKNGVNDQLVTGGEIKKKQKRDVTGAEGTSAMEEWQIFTGNRDVYGFSFKYLNVADVDKVEYPRDLMVIERMEYGDAIGSAVSLESKGGVLVNANEAEFGTRLSQLVETASERRAEITRIEKRDIGVISDRMQKIKIRRASAEKQANGIRVSEADAQLAALQAKYEILAAKAGNLRQEQQGVTLRYRTITGEERTLPVGQIVGFYHPNDLGFFKRLGIFFHQFWIFLSDEPREANTEGGIFPAIFGTFTMTLLMSIVVMPFGIVAAIYLREYARQGFWVRAVRIAVNNLAGVPSIVFGVFGLGFFVYFLGGSIDRLFFSDALPTPTLGTGGVFWASLTLALMTVPVIIVATEEALASVPRGAREASLACGASKWQTIQRVVLPASASGILTGLILAMARGAGEVAPLMLVGVVKLAPSLPIDGDFPFVHLDRKFMHLGFHIYDLGFQSPDSEAAKPMVFATTLFLILLVVLLNLAAILIRERLRRKYATGAF
jgi:phosphate transport system permease protein